ncbi:MAG: hypothetical protein ACXWC4_21335 [Telluria sp.]
MPWCLRSGKCLATTAAEVLAELKPPPQRLFDDSAPVGERANYLRFRLSRKRTHVHGALGLVSFLNVFSPPVATG